MIFLLEEPSAEEMLKGILPKLLPGDVHPEFKVFEGKNRIWKEALLDLERMVHPNCAFVVMRDQDSGDCHAVKQKLVELCPQSGKNEVLVRVACRELESFYLGDLAAVEKGLALSGLAKKQEKRSTAYRIDSAILHKN
ncbi:MAG: hypothetical protein U5R30_14410 [Deltaproteobacteria bacterium]|nr:hypothetical protein [Deltaproteobacteria bacterium]